MKPSVPGIAPFLLCALILSACSSSAIDDQALLKRVQILASDEYEGRRVGTEGGIRARDYVSGEFTRLGLDSVGGDGLLHPFVIASSEGDSLQGYNVLGLVEGSAHPDRYIVLSAHYDHLGVRAGEIFNGADDNASGTSAIIAIAEILKRRRPRHSVIVSALDAEEGGLRGARAFVQDPPVPLEQIVLNINLDMVSRSSARELYAAGTYHYPSLREIIEPLAGRDDVKLLFGHDRPEMGSDDWTSASDHGPFHAVGIPFVYFGVEDHAGYHNPSDDYADITHDFYVDATELILEAVRLLDRSVEGRVAKRTEP